MNKLGFIQTEITIKLSEEGLVYSGVDLANDRNLNTPGIYLVTGNDNNGNVLFLYVGKAGKGINKRFNEHIGGYKRRKSRYADWKSEIEKKLHEGVKKIEVWYRPSSVKNIIDIFPHADFKKDANKIDVSCYSLEEEALLKYFKSLGKDNYLTNSGYPPDIVEADNNQPKQDWEDAFELLNSKIKINSDEINYKIWLEATKTWPDETKECFLKAINLLNSDQLLISENRLSPKIIETYTDGPFKGIPVLVYGRIPNVNITNKSASFTLDGQLMALYSEKNQFKVIEVNDYVYGHTL